MPSSFTNLDTHIVFSTKDREPFLAEALLGRTCEYIGGICRERKCVLQAAGGMPDHVHLLVGVHPAISISDLVRDVKSNTSLWIHGTFPELAAFSWQRCYGAFAVSESNVEAVERYIGSQKEHHREKTFKEEFVALLERHKVPYDPRWMWE